MTGSHRVLVIFGSAVLVAHGLSGLGKVLLAGSFVRVGMSMLGAQQHAE